MADRTPLLSRTHLAIDIETNGHAPDTTPESSQNPFEFIGAGELSIPRPSSVDPFRNGTPAVAGFYEWVKIVVCAPLAVARLVLFGLAMAVGFIATKLALEGWKDRESPMPKWRSRMMVLTRLCSRCILFSWGYHWIKRIGRPASREVAPIVVSNHLSYVEPIFFFYELFPTIVASESHDNMPFVGTIIRAMQVIYVDRFSPSSRKHAVNEIKRKASCNDYPRVLLFPEGTTTNGRALLSFQLGAFIPGFPVQPVVVRYPHIHFDQSWGHISLAKLMLRMFTQFHNFMEDGCSIDLVEMASPELLSNMNTSEAMELLEQFFSMNSDSNGRVKSFDFLIGYGLGLNPLSEKVFCYLDVEKKGSITFRQFLYGLVNVRKQPSFLTACESAFNKCTDSSTTHYISQSQLGDTVRASESSMSDETMHHLFHLFDSDEDGTISRDDFMTCLWRNPLLIAHFVNNV